MEVAMFCLVLSNLYYIAWKITNSKVFLWRVKFYTVLAGICILLQIFIKYIVR